MAKGRKIAIGLVLVVILGIASAKIFQAQLGMFVIQRTIEQRVGRDVLAGLPDGVHVMLCGTGSPLPDPSRAEACTAVLAGKHLLVFDAGEGGARKLAAMGVPMGRIERLFLTHFHSDHIEGLGPMMLLRWTGSAATSPLPIAGPRGVEAIVAGFNAAFTTDDDYRVAHHGPKIVPPSGAGGVAAPFDMPAPGKDEALVVYQADGVTVTAFPVDHRPVKPAVGYRIDYKGRSVTISGDTAFAPSLVRAARDSDLLVHEALQPSILKFMTARLAARGLANTAQITRDVVGYHSTPEQAADAARLAGVRQLVLSHIVPPLPTSFLYPTFLGAAHSHFAGRITIGEDGMIFSLPAGSKSITEKALL